MGSCFSASCFLTHSWQNHRTQKRNSTQEYSTPPHTHFIWLKWNQTTVTRRNSSLNLFSSSSRSRSGRKLVSTSGFLLLLAVFFNGSSIPCLESSILDDEMPPVVCNENTRRSNKKDSIWFTGNTHQPQQTNCSHLLHFPPLYEASLVC